MRKILFRGQSTYTTHKWLYGSYLVLGDKHYILPIDDKVLCNYEVIHETVCQFTGLTDKNGKMIFEGDILNGEIRNNETQDFVVYFLYGGFSIKAPFWAKAKELLYADELILQPLSDAQTASWINSSCKIIGSIHDNQ